MKKVYLLLLTAIFLSSCQEEEISLPIIDGTPQEGAVQSIDFKDLSGPIRQNFDDNHSIKYKPKERGWPLGRQIPIYLPLRLKINKEKPPIPLP